MFQTIKNTLEEYRYAQVIMIIEIRENDENNHSYNNKPFKQVSKQNKA